jgi:hypothetical protein
MVGSFIRALTPLEWPLSDMDDFFFFSASLVRGRRICCLTLRRLHAHIVVVIALLHTDSIKKIMVWRQQSKRFSVNMSI